jgi:DNA-binding transcriptional MerR regulator
MSSIHRAGAAAYNDRATTGDEADREIDRAMKAGDKINLAKAFPYASPPNAGKVTRQNADELGPVTFTPTPHTPRGPTDPRDNTPAARLAHVEAHYKQYAAEYRMQLVHRLLMRGLPLDTIAEMLDLSARRVQMIRQDLFNRLRDEAKQADIYGIAGQTIAFYREVRATAMRIASENKHGVQNQMNALRIALSAEADTHRFLQASGFYDNARFIPQGASSDDTTKHQGQTVIDMTMALLGQGDEDAVDAVFEMSADMDDEDATTLLFGTPGRKPADDDH